MPVAPRSPRAGLFVASLLGAAILALGGLGCTSSPSQAPPTVALESSSCPDCECVGCAVCDGGDCCCADALAVSATPGGHPEPRPEPRPAPVDDPTRDGPVFGAPREALSRDGKYLVRWASAPDPIPFNQPFQLQVAVLDGEDHSTLLSGSTIGVAGWMPDHGHGMSRFPRVESTGDGRFAVHGMLFHMLGLWEIQVDVIHAGVSSRADFEVVLE